MKKLQYFILLSLTLLLTAQVSADSVAGDVVRVVDPYIRAVPPGQKISASFLQLENSSDQPHTVVTASSPAAEVVELHSHIHENGMMKMRRVMKITIPAKGKTVLQPGGLHIMLINLKENLKLNQKVSLTLEFADGSKKTITAPVRKIQMPGMMKKMSL